MSNYLSRRWRHIINTVTLPCSHPAAKLGRVWRRWGTKSHFDGNIQKFDFAPKVKLTRSRQSRYFSPLVSLLGGGVPPREIFPGGWTSRCNTPAQRRNLSKKRHLYLKGSIPSLISNESGQLCSPQCLLKQHLSPNRKRLNRCKTSVF